MGDQTAFDEWVRARGPGLLRFAYLVTGDRHRADEAVQDALVAVCPRWRRIGKLDDPEAYVRRCIVNADISRWRRFLRWETSVAESPAAHAATVADVGDDVTERDAAWELCKSLPTKQRAAIVLRYYEGLPDAAIAQILDCNEATVRSQIHRALAKLRGRLRDVQEVRPS